MYTSKIAGRRVIASISGGKDSAAMSLYLTENGIEHDRVFMDTGWEHQSTYEYLRGELQDKIGNITWLRPPLGFADLCRKKMMFPSRLNRFCTSELKVKPIKKHIQEEQNKTGDVINCVGIRAGESEARSKLSEWEWNEALDCDVWRPLLSWTEEQVIAMHTKHGLRPNPLYLQGASRVGCWPCIFARKQEIKMVSKDDDRIAVIRNLESELGDAAIARNSSNRRPTFFHRVNADFPGIDEVVRWAKTGHGGKQYELLDSIEESGCVRWGLCEHSTK